MNIIRCTNKWIALTVSLLPDLGRRWREASDEGWRSLYCTNDIQYHCPCYFILTYPLCSISVCPSSERIQLIRMGMFVFVLSAR